MKIAGLLIIACILVVASGKRSYRHPSAVVKLKTCATICKKYANSERKFASCKLICYHKVNLFVQKCKKTCNTLHFERNRRQCRMKCIRRGRYLRQGGKGEIIACGHRCQVWRNTVREWAKQLRKCRVSCWKTSSKKRCRKICRIKLRKYIKRRYKLGLKTKHRKIVYICGSGCKLRKWFIRCRVSCRKRGPFQSKRKCRKRCIQRYKQKRYLLQRRIRARKLGLRVRLRLCTRQCARKIPLVNLLSCRRQCFKEYRLKLYKMYRRRKVGRIAYVCGRLCQLRKYLQRCKRKCYTIYCKRKCYSNYRKHRSRIYRRKKYICGVKCRLAKLVRRCNILCQKHSPASICIRKCSQRYKIRRYRISVKKYKCGLECKWRIWLLRCKRMCSRHVIFSRAKRCNLMCDIKYRAHMLGKMFKALKDKRKLILCKHQCGMNHKCFKNCMRKRKTVKQRMRAFMLVRLIRRRQLREKTSFACSFQIGNQITRRLCPTYGKKIMCNGDTLTVTYNGSPATYTFCNYKENTLQPSYVSILVKKSCSPSLHRRQGKCFNGWKCEAGPIRVTYNNKPVDLKFCEGKSFHPLELFGPTFGTKKTFTIQTKSGTVKSSKVTEKPTAKLIVTEKPLTTAGKEEKPRITKEKASRATTENKKLVEAKESGPSVTTAKNK